ncbi:MAG: hypothetical protein GC200_00400 [Tepidisphaera sp.]|nr:hypothetical protein [Tepidisphaera sp.]
MTQAGGPKKAIVTKIKSGAAKATGVAIDRTRKAGQGVAKSAAFMYGNAKDTVKITPRAAKNLVTQPGATIKGAATGVKHASLNNTVGLKNSQQRGGILKTVTSAGMMATGAGIVMAASQGAGHIPAKGVIPAKPAKPAKKAKTVKLSDFEKAAREVE